MKITANGKERPIAAATSVSDLLDQLGLAPERVVVEHNGNPLRRELFARTTLQAGDRIEIAQMVGGG